MTTTRVADVLKRSAGVGQSSPRSRTGTDLQYEWLGDPEIVERKEMVIGGLLGASEVMVVHADTKVGKTQFAADLSFAVATGADWFGRRVKRGAILYLAIEKGRVTRKRLRALQRLNGNIRPPIAVSMDPIDLTDPKQIAPIIAAAREMSSTGLPLRIIVLDTLNRSMAGIDENAAGPVAQVFNSLTRIAEETGAAIVVLHHNTKTNGRLRGSTAIAASADVVLSLEKVDDKIREATVTMANDITEGQTFRFRMQTVELAAATETTEAEMTISIEALMNDETAGALKRARPLTHSKAEIARAAQVLNLFDALAIGGRCERLDLLRAARDQQVVSPHNPNSGAEMLRKSLTILRADERLHFNDHQVWLPAACPMPNSPMHP